MQEMLQLTKFGFLAGDRNVFTAACQLRTRRMVGPLRRGLHGAGSAPRQGPGLSARERPAEAYGRDPGGQRCLGGAQAFVHHE